MFLYTILFCQKQKLIFEKINIMADEIGHLNPTANQFTSTLGTIQNIRYILYELSLQTKASRYSFLRLVTTNDKE